jgi:hypothetical protein
MHLEVVVSMARFGKWGEVLQVETDGDENDLSLICPSLFLV